MKGLRVGLVTGLASLLVHVLAIKLFNAPVAPVPPPSAQLVSFSFESSPPSNQPADNAASSPKSAALAAPPLAAVVQSAHGKPTASEPRRERASIQAPPIADSRSAPPANSAIARNTHEGVVVPAPLRPGEPPSGSSSAAVESPTNPKLDISPRAVALGSLPPMAAPANNSAPVPAREASASLSAGLYAAANAHLARRRPPIELTRDPDGTCHYAGEAIAATILPDGGVEVQDMAAKVSPRYGVAEPRERPTTLEDQQAPRRLQIAMRTEARAWEAERDWFLRETKQLRTKLADAARDRELAEAEEVFRRQLDRVWCDTTLSFGERHRRIFTLWDDTSPDEIGARARSAVVEYVRYHLAANSSHAFTHTELDSLNAGRSQRDRFDPYAASVRDAGVGNP